MATVYEVLLERKTTKQLGKEFTSIMNVKLTQLLKTTCNIYLSSIAQPFKQWHYIDFYKNDVYSLTSRLMLIEWAVCFVLYLR